MDFKDDIKQRYQGHVIIFQVILKYVLSKLKIILLSDIRSKKCRCKSKITKTSGVTHMSHF